MHSCPPWADKTGGSQAHSKMANEDSGVMQVSQDDGMMALVMNSGNLKSFENFKTFMIS